MIAVNFIRRQSAINAVADRHWKKNMTLTELWCLKNSPFIAVARQCRSIYRLQRFLTKEVYQMNRCDFQLLYCCRRCRIIYYIHRVKYHDSWVMTMMQHTLAWHWTVHITRISTTVKYKIPNRNRHWKLKSFAWYGYDIRYSFRLASFLLLFTFHCMCPVSCRLSRLCAIVRRAKLSFFIIFFHFKQNYHVCVACCFRPTLYASTFASGFSCVTWLPLWIGQFPCSFYGNVFLIVWFNGQSYVRQNLSDETHWPRPNHFHSHRTKNVIRLKQQKKKMI